MKKKPAPKTVPIDQAILAAQGIALSTHYLLSELLIDVARLHPSPEDYLEDLFERVSQKVDPQDLKIPQKEVFGVARAWLSDLFAGASRRLRNNPDQGQT